MSRQDDQGFLRSMHFSSVLDDSEYLRFTVEERDRLLRLACEEPKVETHWCPSHRELQLLLDKANSIQKQMIVARVAAKLTS